MNRNRAEVHLLGQTIHEVSNFKEHGHAAGPVAAHERAVRLAQQEQAALVAGQQVVAPVAQVELGPVQSQEA